MSNLLLGIKRGRTVKNIRKIQIHEQITHITHIVKSDMRESLTVTLL